MQNFSDENEFDLHLSELVRKTDFHMKGFALGLLLKKRQRELGNGLLYCQGCSKKTKKTKTKQGCSNSCACG